MTFLTSEAESLAGLLPHHTRELRASGLSDAMIVAAGLRSETNYDRLASLLEWPKFPKKLAPALVIPFHSPDGTNGYAQIKPDHPRVRDGKPIKYESPRGRSNQVYFPPGVAERIANPANELIFTEGEKKALKGMQEGFPTIGLNGAFGWKDGKRESLLPALERIEWHGREVYIIFDSDVATNENVQDAESRLAAHLERRGAKVSVVRLPPGPDGTKVGLDDFLVAHGPVPLRKLLDEASEPEPVDTVTAREDACNLDPATEAGKFLTVHEQDKVSRFVFWRGSFYLWINGRYLELESSEARGELIRHLNRNFRQLNMNVTSNVMDQLKAQSALPSRVEPPAWIGDQLTTWPADEMLATRNGLVHLPSLVTGSEYFIPATPRYFTTNALDYEFDADAPAPSLWLEFLDRLFQGDLESISTLQEWFGYFLTPDTRQQKILMLIGPKRGGKGTIARVLRGLIGPENVAGPTLAGLATNFGLWPLLGKSVAIISDARLSGRSDQAVIVERLLSISGEDALTIDRKYLEPVTCKILARLLYLSNELPHLVDSSGELASRMILLRLTRSFLGLEDMNLTSKLLAERPGILLWSIEGWRRLRERGYFVQPATGRELITQLEDLASPIGLFLRERCQLGPEYRTSVDDLFAEWKRWCESKGRREHGIEQTFGRDLLAAVPTLKRTQPREDGERYRAYDGIGLVNYGR